MASEAVKAAQAEVGGSWRKSFADWTPQTAKMQWDGKEWDIPAKMPQDYYDAQRTGDSLGMIRAVIGIDGLNSLRIPRDYPAEGLLPLIESLSDAAGKVWGTGNL